MQFLRTRDDRTWRAGGLAGLLQPSDDRGGAPASVPWLQPATSNTSNIRTCGRRGRRPSNRFRDNYGILGNPRRSYLEGRRPRQLVATCDIKRIKHPYPWDPGQGTRPPKTNTYQRAEMVIPHVLTCVRAQNRQTIQYTIYPPVSGS